LLGPTTIGLLGWDDLVVSNCAVDMIERQEDSQDTHWKWAAGKLWGYWVLMSDTGWWCDVDYCEGLWGRKDSISGSLVATVSRVYRSGRCEHFRPTRSSVLNSTLKSRK